MNTLKDTQNTVIKQHDRIHSDISHISNTVPESNYRTLADRAQRITTAAYMISDVIDGDTLVSENLRTRCVLAMQSLFDNSAHNGDSLSLKKAQQYFYEMLSYADILFRTGSLSQMNYSVLVNVVHGLQSDIHDEITKLSSQLNSPARDTEISLESYFSAKTVKEKKTETLLSTENKVLDSVTERNINQVSRTAAVEKPKTATPISTGKKQPVAIGQNVLEIQKDEKPTKLSAKDKRHENISKILKQKKDASINDICALFADCSSKTIQRDLNEMIDNGLVMKRGDRRWSVYNLK